MRRMNEGFVRDAITKVSDFVRGRKIIATPEDAEAALAAVTEKQAESAVYRVLDEFDDSVRNEYSGDGWWFFKATKNKLFSDILKRTDIVIRDDKFAWKLGLKAKVYNSDEFEELFDLISLKCEDDFGTDLYLEKGYIVMDLVPECKGSMFALRKSVNPMQAFQIMYDYIDSYGDIEKELGKYKDITDMVYELYTLRINCNRDQFIKSPFVLSDSFIRTMIELDNYVRDKIAELTEEFRK